MLQNNNDLTVSIIIPVFNVSAYIERCLRSVMHQTYDNIECIIVDDATPDDSIEKCEQVIKDYHGSIRFVILHHQHNRGLSAARNTGTTAASGDYIYYLDSDDELTSDCIEKLLKPIMHDDTIEMVMGNFLRVPDGCSIRPSERQTLQLKETNLTSNNALRDYYFRKGIWQASWNKLIKRSFLCEHQISFKVGLYWEDTLWLYFVVKYLNHFYTIPDVTYHYMKRPGALTTGMVKHKILIQHWCIVYDEIANHFTEGEEGREAKYHMRDFCYKCINNPDNREFRRVAKKYKKTLAANHLYKDYVLLSTISFLSRFSMGIKCFQFASKKLKKSYSRKL